MNAILEVDGLMDLENYLDAVGGREVIRFDWVSDDAGDMADAARAYAGALREVYQQQYGDRAPKIYAEGVRVIIERTTCA